jgi:hypothetical protein
MSSSGMLHRVALVRMVVSRENNTSIFTVTRIGELRKTLAVTSNRLTLLTLFPIRRFCHPDGVGAGPSETSVLTRGASSSIPEDAILHINP